MACLNYNLRSLQAGFSGGRARVRNHRSGCAGRVKLLGLGTFNFFAFNLHLWSPQSSSVSKIKDDAPSCTENTPAMHAV